MKTQLITKRKLNQGIVQYALITMLILTLGAYFGYIHYTEYQAATKALNEENLKLSELKGAADKSKKDYLALKKEMDAQNSGVNQSIEKILPSNEDFTNLARDLDKYFLNTTGTANPMFLSDLRFNSPQFSDDQEFAILPFSMNFSGNEDGFKQFLNFIETSGDLNDRTRLLSIANINLNYQLPEESPTPVPTGESFSLTGSTPVYQQPTLRNVAASMTLDAYFQKPIKVDSPVN